MMNDMFKKTNVIITIIALSILALIGITNTNNILKNVLPHFSEEKSVNERINEIDGNYIDDFFGKNFYINIYGIFQRAIGRRIIGNFEYVTDKHGTIDQVINNFQYVDSMVEDVKELKRRTDSINTPLLFVQGPNKNSSKKNDVEYTFNDLNQCDDVILERLQTEGIQTADMRKLLTEDSNVKVAADDLFLHTDLHMSSEGEIAAASKLVELLENNFGLKFSNKEMLDVNGNRFVIENHRMLGNYGRNVGLYYVPIDDFMLFWPIQDTHYELIDYVTGETKKGTFKDVCLNGYENSPQNEYTYWVTDYLRFQCPYYVIDNKDVSDGPEICLITDSIGYRTISLMSLTCSKITIIDPRFFGGTDYIMKAFSEHKFDAVVVYEQFLNNLAL